MKLSWLGAANRSFNTVVRRGERSRVRLHVTAVLIVVACEVARDCSDG